ncbi:hypothetical protein Tco_0701399 [Tanacetum coccineum]
MDKGFLNRISNGSKEVNKGFLEKGSLLRNIAAKVKNIDGKILGRDGKPMVARRCVRFSETTKESACGDGHDVIVDSNKVEHSPQAVAKCAVHDDCTRPVHGRNDTRVNDLNSHTNDAPVEHVISSAVCLHMEAIDEIKARFVNSLYGFPVGKRLTFPMVENYVKYAWAKYGLKRVMMHHGFFMFQFDSDSGMVKVMEDGPWRIQLVPIILNVWRLNTLLQKDKVTHVLLWLKMHNVPIVAYSKVGLDLILAKPPRCGTCKIFDHLDSVCPIKHVAGSSKQSDMQADEKKDTCASHGGKQDDKISSKKPSSSLEVINEDSDTDVDEVLLPDISTSFPSSSSWWWAIIGKRNTECL